MTNIFFELHYSKVWIKKNTCYALAPALVFFGEKEYFFITTAQMGLDLAGWCALFFYSFNLKLEMDEEEAIISPQKRLKLNISFNCNLTLTF